MLVLALALRGGRATLRAQAGELSAQLLILASEKRVLLFGELSAQLLILASEKRVLLFEVNALPWCSGLLRLRNLAGNELLKTQTICCEPLASLALAALEEIMTGRAREDGVAGW